MSRFSRAIFTQLAGLTLLGAGLLFLTRFFPLAEWIGQLQARLQGMPFWGAVLYPLLFAACNLLLLPGGAIAMGGGLFFGLWRGTALVLAGNALAAAAAFGISRCVGRAWLERVLLRRANPAHQRRWQALDAAVARHGWKIIFLSQIHPLFPTSLLNYLYGVTRIRFATCLLWITLGQLPGLFLYAYLGTLARVGLAAGGASSAAVSPLAAQGKAGLMTQYGGSLQGVLWIVGLALTLVVTTALGQLALRLLRETEAQAMPGEVAGEMETGVADEVSA